MSGAFDSSFQAPIPGSSLTHKMGSLPHEKPPKYTDPNDALEYFWKQFQRPDIMQQIWQIARQGGTAFAIARAILFKASLMGIIQMNLGVVIYPVVQQMVIVIVKARGITPKIHPKFKNKLRDAMIKEQMKELMQKYGYGNPSPAGDPFQAMVQKNQQQDDQSDQDNQTQLPSPTDQQQPDQSQQPPASGLMGMVQSGAQ